MSWTSTWRLDAGDRFPSLSLDLVGGGSLVLPGAQRTVLLVYRGHW